mmetsp:Transcript_4776/g.7227  ORF Transcript_4776/g.7227 Transcript_4776/m.7227 type:complete len:116 (+) Transcript_4776:52-399(+)
MNANKSSEQLLRELDDAEGDIAEMLDLAGNLAENLSNVEGMDSSSTNDICLKYLSLIEKVHACLTSKAHLMKNYAPFEKTNYKSKWEVEILEMKREMLEKDLKDVASRRKRDQPS